MGGAHAVLEFLHFEPAEVVRINVLVGGDIDGPGVDVVLDDEETP